MLTLRYNDHIWPSLVGCDIACGMTCIEVKKHGTFSLSKLDRAAEEYIPVKARRRKNRHKFTERIEKGLAELYRHGVPFDMEDAFLQIGTLGSGNHFIELDKDAKGKHYLIVHSGSRNLGMLTYEYFMDIAMSNSKGLPRALSYLEGDNMQSYLECMNILYDFAYWSRQAMLDELMNNAGLISCGETINSVHNYVDTNDHIIRKGATSAKKGEKLIVPLNMKDGVLICEGLGNPEWNYSFAHGAGRKMSRTEAKKRITMNDFEKAMEGIYTSCLTKNTIDEAPQAYKPVETILDNCEGSVKILNRIYPEWNFKG